MVTMTLHSISQGKLKRVGIRAAMFVSHTVVFARAHVADFAILDNRNPHIESERFVVIKVEHCTLPHKTYSKTDLLHIRNNNKKKKKKKTKSPIKD